MLAFSPTQFVHTQYKEIGKMFDIGTAGLGLIDYTIFFAVLVAVLVVGIRSGGKVKNLDDYAISREKRFSTPVLAMTLIVSVIGSNTSIGAISEVYNNGIIYLIVALLYTIGKVLVILYATNFIAGRYFGAISLYGIIESEYGLIPARLSAIFSVLLSLVSLAMQIIGMGYVMKIFIGMPFVWGAAISTFVFVMYSSISGIRGVVYTDVLQFFIVLVIFPILLAIIVYNAGSLQNVFASLPEQKTIIFEHPQFQEHVYLILFWSFPFGFLRADSIQRFLMCKDGNELKSMGLSYVLFYVVFSLIVSIIGLSALSLVPGITGKEVLPLLMKNHFPIGLKGLAITAFFAIIMSTADSVLNAATVLIAEVQMGRKKTTPQQNKAIHKMDKKTSEGDETDITWLRISSVVLGTIAFILSLLDFSLIKVMTVASAIAFVAVNIPVFFAPFKERGKSAVNAYTGSAVGGLGAFLTLWLTLGQNKLYMVSFYTTFFAVAGWFIGANFFDKIKTNFWRRMWKTYAPKFNTRPILDSARGHAYFVVFGIVTFSLRYILNVWQPFVPGNIIISIAFTISCSLLLILYFGDKIKIISHKLFIALWLITLFMVLPMYNMIAVLQHPDNMIEIVSLVISVLILNLTLSWSQARLFL
jgi:SSS family solute:Na+ symporter